MRIFSDTITYQDLHSAMADAQVEATSVCLDTSQLVEKNGRRRAHAFYGVSLEGYGARHTRNRNSGRYGGTSHSGYAATWMDWGWFMAVLFRYDPAAVIGHYDGREGFLHQTQRMIPHRLGAWGRGDPSVRTFAMHNAALWPNPLADCVDWRRWPMHERLAELDTYYQRDDDGNVTWGLPSPFTLVDRLCPPDRLITLHPVENAIAWLNGPDNRTLIA